MPMSPEKWNALKPGDTVTDVPEGRVWMVRRVRPLEMVTAFGYKQTCGLELLGRTIKKEQEGFFFRDMEGLE